ncbi:MAG TPA: hypothetical protein VF941_14250 [Clostridia bacterium]
MKKISIKEGKQLFQDISTILKQTFPYYESDDLDDYHYLVKEQHVNSATMRIIEYLDRCLASQKPI